MCEIISRRKPEWDNFDADFGDKYDVNRRRCIFLTNAEWIRSERQKIIDVESAKNQAETEKRAKKAAQIEQKRHNEINKILKENIRLEKAAKKRQDEIALRREGLQGARVGKLREYIGVLRNQIAGFGVAPRELYQVELITEERSGILSEAELEALAAAANNIECNSSANDSYTK
jgi:hypothetical protein